MKKIVLVCVLLALAGGLAFSDINQHLSLAGLKNFQQQLQAWQQAAPIFSGVLFTLLYVLTTMLSLPGAAVLTLAGGVFFGMLWGTLLVSLASTLGALLAFLIARFLLRDTIQRRFGDRLQSINDGMTRDGAFYLFTLRLVPVVPFFLINLLMGLTPIGAWTFTWVSQLGMLAGTLVYVNAGTQLAKIDSLGEILSPGLLLAFTLLGFFPLLAKYLLSWIKQQQVYARWKKPAHFDRNLIVIGAGAAGLVTAYIAAAVKARVTLVEAAKMGGDCLNYGCVPSKALIRSAKLAHQLRHGQRYGLQDSEPDFRFTAIMQRIQQIIATVAPHDSVERYTQLGVEVIKGHAQLRDPWTVAIRSADGQEQQLTSRAIVIAAGAHPWIPPLPGINEVGYLTSDTLWEAFSTLDTLPKRLVVLGGGPIGCELSQALARLGAKVWQVERGERLLAREDPDVSALVETALRADGVQVLTASTAVRCGRDAGGKYLVVRQGEQEIHLPFEHLICAVGRTARLTGYGLEELGIPVERTVVTNVYLETLYPNIYAAGDVAGPYQFTHTASHQAWYAAVNALFGGIKKFRADYSVIPWTTFIDPEIARVGINEQEARAQGIAVEVTLLPLAEIDRAIADSATQGFIKVLTPPGSDRILGVTIACEHGGELLAEFVLAMRHGLGLNKILATIHTYPTLAEASKYVASAWKRTHTSPRLLALLERYHQWQRG